MASNNGSNDTMIATRRIGNRGEILERVVEHQLRPDHEIPYMTVGDTLDVHVRIVEGNKERVQVFQGVLISRKGRGINAMITVRRIVANEGVERIFPVHSPRVSKIEVVRRADARRAKLYFLRERVGKARRLREQRRQLGYVQRMEARKQQAVEAAQAAAAAAAPAEGEGGGEE